MQNTMRHLEAALKRHRAGDLDGAEMIYQELLETAPGQADALHLWGLVAHQRGDHETAIARIEKAIAVAPGNPGFHAGLGIGLHAAGRLEEAEESLNRALELKPGDAAVEFKLGNVLADLKLYNAAAQTYRRVLDTEPRRQGARFNLALALLKARRFTEAAEAYRSVLDLDAKNAAAHTGLGVALFEVGQYDEALGALDAAIEEAQEDSDTRSTRIQRAMVLFALGRIEEGVTAAHGALEGTPDYERQIADIARRCVLDDGSHKSAMALLDPLIRNGCDSPPVVWAFALVAPHFGRGGEAIEYARRLLDGERTTAEGSRWLHFSLARLYDRQAAYDDAFAHFSKANALYEVRYDRANVEARRTASVVAFSRSAMTEMPRAENDSELPLFIVGMPRSGTTLVEQILCSHPSIHGGDELTTIHEITATLSEVLGTDTPYPECMQELTIDQATLVARRYLDKLEDLGEGADRVSDKMPHNFRYLGLIAVLFPRARIIHCARDPLDCCVSNFFQEFVAEGLSYSVDLADIGHHYGVYREMMSHWHAVLDIPILSLAYEKLVADQEGMSRKLVEYCGLPWDDACLRFHENPRAARTASFDQVRHPMYTSSVGRSQHYRAHLEPLIAALQEGGVVIGEDLPTGAGGNS